MAGILSASNDARFSRRVLSLTNVAHGLDRGFLCSPLTLHHDANSMSRFSFKSISGAIIQTKWRDHSEIRQTSSKWASLTQSTRLRGDKPRVHDFASCVRWCKLVYLKHLGSDCSPMSRREAACLFGCRLKTAVCGGLAVSREIAGTTTMLS